MVVSFFLSCDDPVSAYARKTMSYPPWGDMVLHAYALTGGVGHSRVIAKSGLVAIGLMALLPVE